MLILGLLRVPPDGRFKAEVGGLKLFFFGDALTFDSEESFFRSPLKGKKIKH